MTNTAISRREQKVFSFPLSGIKSATMDNDNMILGEAENSNIYMLMAAENSNSSSMIYSLILLDKIGDNKSVNAMLNFEANKEIIAVGNGLYVESSNPLQIFSNGYIGSVNTTSNTSTISFGSSVKVLELPEDEEITDILQRTTDGMIIFSTSRGRIISCNDTTVNAYLTGDRIIYANVRDGFGLSDITATTLMYALYNRIAKINEDREIEKWKFVVKPSAILSEKITGSFLGPVINVKEDLGFWKELVWEEVKPDDTDVIVSLKSGNSLSELTNASWKYAFSSNVGETGTITRSLNNTSITGQYLQVKVDIVTNKNNVTPVVSKVTVKYSTKQASYFFTTKFTLAKDSKTDRGLLVATVTEPQNTEVIFGVASEESDDWQDYQVISPDKLFDLSNINDVKVGIKFVSYDTGIPEVAEFALMLAGEEVKILDE